MSKLQIKKECWFCANTQNLELHHIFFGSRRKMSDKYKDQCTVWLCHDHHTGTNQAVHNSRQMDLALKHIGQSTFEKDYGHEKFMEIFGKNYLGVYE